MFLQPLNQNQSLVLHLKDLIHIGASNCLWIDTHTYILTEQVPLADDAIVLYENDHLWENQGVSHFADGTLQPKNNLSDCLRKE